MNKDKLKGIIRGYGDTQAILAKEMGISTSALNAKMNGKAEFKQGEILFLKKRYGLSYVDLDDIFFAS